MIFLSFLSKQKLNNNVGDHQAKMQSYCDLKVSVPQVMGFAQGSYTYCDEYILQIIVANITYYLLWHMGILTVISCQVT